ncbi:peptidoglycan bridge formation glycyltransferase FemA/FemB family protein (plasmid) [Halorussus salilacus]|uniref:lipid II:glycine glycyltransferase FemX n=1 Tax=Halorussus salilacus TaxID=2953750 RepID=UPI0020A0F639|nr:peptidoglycan bridge formation glycyltransferase FemA/FemB family protein [Halorussus salilacus]USZ69740.1 peptidoglycan bridge formation glycyltransferase FemA/FemB family protein [Halorussus salilacus]
MSLSVIGVDTIESVNENQWNQVVEQSDLGYVYHRYGWLRAVELGTAYEPRHLLVTKKNNPIAIFPNFIMDSDRTPYRHLKSSKPGPGGPIAMTDEEEAIQLLLDVAPEIGDKMVISSQIQTSGTDYSRYHSLFEENGYEQRLVYGDFTLDISRDWEDILGDMHSSRRRAIRRGHDNEFEIVDKEITRETMAEFFDDFSAVMDRVEGYKRPRRYFLELAEFSERLKLFGVRIDGDERGTILFTLDDEQSTVHYECSGVTQENFEYNASELIHEHAIRWAQERGYDTYNFGGTVLDFRDGVFRFKEKFGARPVPALAWERGCSTVQWPAYKFARSLYRRFFGS